MSMMLSDSQVQAIVTEYTSDESITLTKLAKEYRVSRQTIANVLKRNGVETRHFVRLSQKEKEEIMRLYKAHKNISTISRETGRSKMTISSFLLKVLPENEHRYVMKFQPESDGEALQAEYMASAMSHEELAKAHHVTRSTISRRISKAAKETNECGAGGRAVKRSSKRKNRKLPITPEKLFKERRATGATQRELADKYEVSQSCIYHALARLRKKEGRSVEEERAMIPKKPYNF